MKIKREKGKIRSEFTITGEFYHFIKDDVDTGEFLKFMLKIIKNTYHLTFDKPIIKNFKVDIKSYGEADWED